VRVRDLESQNQQLKSEVERLGSTEQGSFQRAVDLEQTGRLESALAAYDAFGKSFPASANAAEAKRRGDVLVKKVAAQRAEAKKALAGLDRRIASAPDSQEATKILDEVAKTYPLEEVQLAVEKQRAELKEMVEKEQVASTNSQALGIEITSVRTYWTVDPNVMGGKELVVPYIRFVVKNVSGRPITKLHAKAAFELVEKREMLGDGSTYVIGFSDPPLKPGYSKEVFFGSSTGFTGYGIYMNRPKTTADLYVQTSEGEERLVKTVKISPRLDI
jgi:hypothetical protein